MKQSGWKRGTRAQILSSSGLISASSQSGNSSPYSLEEGLEKPSSPSASHSKNSFKNRRLWKSLDPVRDTFFEGSHSRLPKLLYHHINSSAEKRGR